jgi:DNA-binding response OmpR family regulator
MDAPDSFTEITRYLDVMVIDGNDLFCFLVEEFLKRSGFNNVHVATNEEMALVELKRHRFDVVVLEACHEYRKIWQYIASQQRPPFLLVGMTFDQNGRDWLGAFEYGADAVLTKPFTRARLARTVSDLLVSPASRRCKIVQHPAMARTSIKRDDYLPL